VRAIFPPKGTPCRAPSTYGQRSSPPPDCLLLRPRPRYPLFFGLIFRFGRLDLCQGHNSFRPCLPFFCLFECAEADRLRCLSLFSSPLVPLSKSQSYLSVVSFSSFEVPSCSLPDQSDNDPSPLLFFLRPAPFVARPCLQVMVTLEALPVLLRGNEKASPPPVGLFGRCSKLLDRGSSPYNFFFFCPFQPSEPQF